MSNRDHQNKYDKENNISSSMYDRVNASQTSGNTNTNRTTGSMNNSDEKAPDPSSFSTTLFNYIFRFVFTLGYIFIGLWVFKDYFYGEGIDQLLPSVILLFVSIVLGFISTKMIQKAVYKYK